MSVNRIVSYQAEWNADTQTGKFYFRLFNGLIESVEGLSNINYRIILDFLRNERDTAWSSSQQTIDTIQQQDVGEGEL